MSAPGEGTIEPLHESPDPERNVGSRSREAHRTARPKAAAAALVAALSAFVLRLGPAASVFAGGAVTVGPFDEAYHARRIVHAAEHLPTLPDPDPRRGTEAEFCPWPPLYDLGIAAVARAVGARDPEAVLAVAVWIPPLLGAAAAAMVAFAIGASGGLLPGLLAGLLLAATPAHLSVSTVGAIDHHAAEPVTLLLVLAAALHAARATTRAEGLSSGFLLCAAVLPALFLQPSLLLAAGAACGTLLVAGLRRPSAAGAGAVGLAGAAAAVALWGLTRPAAYPSSSWYLGAPHAAVLAAGAVALAVVAARQRIGGSPGAALAVGLAAGVAVPLAWPGAPSAFLQGVSFLGGDPWLDRIVEFRPLVSLSDPRSFLAAAATLGGGALVVLPFLAAWRRLDRADVVLGLWAAGALAAALARARFGVLAAPLLALVAGRAVSLLASSGRRVAAGTTAAAVVLPLAFAGLPALVSGGEVVPDYARPALRAALFLRERCGPGARVLAPWSWGHALDLVGGCPVLVDGFGSAPDRKAFDDALAASLETREERLVRFCQERRVRWIVLTNPLFALAETAGATGLGTGHYLAPPPSPGAPARVTHLAQATVWWRAYFAGRPAPSPLPPPRLLRRVWADPRPAWEPAPYGGPAMEVWEVPPRP